MRIGREKGCDETEWIDAVTPGVYAAIASAIISMGGLVLQYFLVVAKMQSRIMSLEVKIGPFWSLVEKNLPQLLMQPTHFQKDALLLKMVAGHLNLCEAKELMTILEVENSAKEQQELSVVRILVMGRLAQMIQEMGGGAPGKAHK